MTSPLSTGSIEGLTLSEERNTMRAPAPAEGRHAPISPTHAIGLPDALLDPTAYAGRPESVELRETHISWVFLAGGMAYKVKKPVRLPFLDYGTLARRRACCEAELRLNRRFAPDVYREVVGLVPRVPDGLAVASEHDPRAVEYAVVMNRYDESTTLLAALAHGRATAADLVAVGTAVAGFHAAAPVEPDAGMIGSPGSSRRPWPRSPPRVRRPDGSRRSPASAAPRSAASVPSSRTGRRPASSATATATCARSTCCSAATSRRSTASSSTATCGSPTSVTTWPS